MKNEAGSQLSSAPSIILFAKDATPLNIVLMFYQKTRTVHVESGREEYRTENRSGLDNIG